MLSPHWRKGLSSLFRSTNRKPYRKARPQRRKRTILELEPLEMRLVPSLLTVTLVAGSTLELYGTSTTSTPGEVTEVLDGTPTQFSGVTAIRIQGGGAGATVSFDDNGGSNSSVNVGTANPGDDITVSAAASSPGLNAESCF
jgi:hypothetical protein